MKVEDKIQRSIKKQLRRVTMTLEDKRIRRNKLRHQTGKHNLSPANNL